MSDQLTAYLSQFPITDGFVMSTKQRCKLTYRDIVLEQYEKLRRAGGYRQKQWLVPKDSTIVIPKFDSYEYQLFMEPGSAIWGYTFVANTGGGDVESPKATLSFNIRDGCDDIPVFSEVVTQIISGGNFSKQQFFSTLLIVGKPGLLNVEICNTYDVDFAPAQLVLYGGEPAPL